MPLCPSGAGHQGQDIRPPSYKDNSWEAVAVTDGIISNVTSNTTVQLKAADGTDYFYLHMHPKSIGVKTGQKVKQGDVLGRVSKYMGGTPSTSLHLHFNVRQRIKVGSETLQVYVPTFTSLIAALRRDKGLDPGIDTDGNLIVDPLLEVGATAPSPTPTPPAPTPPAPAPSPTPAPAPTPAPPEPAPAPAPDAVRRRPPRHLRHRHRSRRLLRHLRRRRHQRLHPRQLRRQNPRRHLHRATRARAAGLVALDEGQGLGVVELGLAEMTCATCRRTTTGIIERRVRGTIALRCCDLGFA